MTIDTLRELVRTDLQMGWSHLEDGNEDFALHHLGSAVRKVNEIKQLKSSPASPVGTGGRPPQPQSLSYLNDHPIKGNID